jgi:sulfite exporter TauE/SafE
MPAAPYIPMLAFSWGLAGGFSHCIGMCGVFVAAYTGPTDVSARPSSKGPTSPQVQAGGAATTTAPPHARAIGSGLRTSALAAGGRHMLFHAGRLTSLVTLGMIAGALGSIGHQWAAAQGVVSIAAGVLMVGLALGFAGIMPWLRIPEPDVLGAGGGVLRRLFARALRSDSASRPLLIGLFVGLLPCGLTYQALIPAALSGSIARAALIMALFCAGTIPGLLTFGVAGNLLFGGLLMRPHFRLAMTKVAAFIMAVIGVVFVWRGLGGF